MHRDKIMVDSIPGVSKQLIGGQLKTASSFSCNSKSASFISVLQNCTIVTTFPASCC